MSNRIVNAHVDGAKLTENNVDIKDLVVVENSQAVTNSLKVAEVFGKQHKHVLEAIRNLLSTKVEKSALVDNQLITSMFTLIEIEQPMPAGGGVKKVPMYVINRDGFTLLAMGFTGEKALRFKLEYIKAFNAMEAKLRESHHVGMQSFIAPVSKTTNAMALTLSNLNRLQEDYVRRLYELEKKGYSKADKKANEFSSDFMKIRDDILYLIINEEIYDVECYGNGLELLQNMRNSQDE